MHVWHCAYTVVIVMYDILKLVPCGTLNAYPKLDVIQGHLYDRLAVLCIISFVWHCAFNILGVVFDIFKLILFIW